MCKYNAHTLFDLIDINLAFAPNVSGYIIITPPFGRLSKIFELSNADTPCTQKPGK